MQGVLKESEPKQASDEQCCGSCCTFLSDVCSCKAISLRKMLISCCPQTQLDLDPLVTCPCFRTDSSGQVNETVNDYFMPFIEAKQQKKNVFFLAVPVSELCLL